MKTQEHTTTGSVLIGSTGTYGEQDADTIRK